MARLSVTSDAQQQLDAGTTLKTAVTLKVGGISAAIDWSLDGDGSAAGSAPNQVYIKYTDVTGVQTIDLNALTGPAGQAVNLANVREITVFNHSTTDGETLTVGGNASSPFIGPLGGAAETVDVEPGGALPLVCKRYGTGYATSGANNLDLDFGANTFSAEVVIKGNV